MNHGRVLCRPELFDGDLRKGADLVVFVERQAVTVGPEYQKQADQKCRVGEAYIFEKIS